MNFDNLRFTEEHEWVRREDGTDEVTIGISEFAAGELGDIVYIELPQTGAEVKASDSMGTIEAVKTVADLYAPVTGVIVAINDGLEGQPEMVNNSPYEDGWFARIRMADVSELDGLMTHDAYQEMLGKG